MDLIKAMQVSDAINSAAKCQDDFLKGFQLLHISFMDLRVHIFVIDAINQFGINI